MNTRIQQTKRPATDETRIRHRFGTDIEEENTETTDIGRGRTHRGESSVDGMPNRGDRGGRDPRKVGKGGKEEARNWEKAWIFPTFSHHFPAFPTFSHINFYLRDEREDTAHPLLPQPQAHRVARGEWCEIISEKLRVVTHCSAKVHEVSRKFTQIRPVNPRCYALLRVRLFFNHG